MITILLLLCLTALCFSAAAETTDEEATLLTEGFRPVVEQLSTYYNISKLDLIDSHWETNALGTALYGTFRLELTLKANSLDELPHFQGVLRFTGMDSAVNVTLSDIQAAQQTSTAAFFADSSTPAVLRNRAAVQAFAELNNLYGEYIGKASESYYSICVTTTPEGELDAAYADCEGVRRALSIYFPESAQKMQQNGIDQFQQIYTDTLTQMSEESQIMALNPLYYRVEARDYANLYTSEASYSQTCPHGKHYIDLSKYNPSMQYFCHTDCANFVSQAVRAGQIPTDSSWQPYTLAWNCADDMYYYFYGTKHYIAQSSFTYCNAGGLIFNFEYDENTGAYEPYHVNLCVKNDTVTRAYSAHNNDHKNKTYTSGYWGDEQYFMFPNSTTDEYQDPGVA